MTIHPLGANQTEIEIGDKTLLYSYKTLVAVHSPAGTFVTQTHYSVTTSRHVNLWLKGHWLTRYTAVSQEELEQMAD